MLAFGGKKKEPTQFLWDLSTPEGRQRYLDSIGQETKE